MAEIQPQPLPKSTVPARVTWAGAPPRGGQGWKAADHWGAMPLETHCLGSQRDLYKQRVLPPASMTYCPAVWLHVTQVPSAPAHGLGASAHLLSGVLFYDSRSET